LEVLRIFRFLIAQRIYSLMRLFFLPILLYHHLAYSTCYYPNGTAISPLQFPEKAVWTDYAPCNPDPNAVSMCCAINRTTGAPPDTCLPNGLCYVSWSRVTWRESCSDPTWQSKECLGNVCTNFSVRRTSFNIWDFEISKWKVPTLISCVERGTLSR
jgi:hypothetical protein